MPNQLNFILHMAYATHFFVPSHILTVLVMGSILGCRNAGVAMAASLSMSRSPLLRIDTPRKGGRKDSDEPASIEEMKQQNILKERAELFDKIGGSDHAFLTALFLNWKECEGQGRKAYCDSLGLSFMGMREMSQMASQLDNALQAIGYTDTPASNRNGRFWSIIRAVAVAGMAPGQLVKVVRPGTKYLQTAEGMSTKMVWQVYMLYTIADLFFCLFSTERCQGKRWRGT
jgi:hypothetical protein